MIMMTKIPKTTAPPTAVPITTPFSFPFVLASLFPGSTIPAEVDAALVAKDD